jgi:hypothetical protein
MKKLIAWCAVVALIALPVTAGEWHTGQNNLCTDCHTMHFSQQHNWDGTTPVSTEPAKDGNWLSTTGPNHYLLKAPANQICLACHDGQTFAPDVMGINTNAAPSQGRSAGALNEVSGAAPYDAWKGHTLDSTDTPPGFDPVKVGLSATWYQPADGLECIHCHTQHGRVGAYRNLGPRALTPPSYVINTTNDTTKDVWINVAAPYTPNSGSDATFNPYYDNANIQYNRSDAVVGTTKTSNKLDTFCAACHGNFHGGPSDVEIGGVGTPAAEFIRHPTGQVSIGALSGGHSSLSRFAAVTTKVKVYTNDRTAWTNTSPGCVSCHKAHGNQNPFGLVFLSSNAASVGEEGGYAAGQTEHPNGYQQGYRNLCGQCHGQGAGPFTGPNPNN